MFFPNGKKLPARHIANREAGKKEKMNTEYRTPA